MHLDQLFHQAADAIDSGDISTLERLLTAHPQLTRERLRSPGAWLREKTGSALDGFFKDPYLLWLVAEDPVRNNTLPSNISNITALIVQHIKKENPQHLQEQLDYALKLVCWSTVARDCGVQIALLDVLIDAGAFFDIANEPLVNKNFQAAERLVQRGAKLTLAVALCLDWWQEVDALSKEASDEVKQFCLTLTALNGKTRAIRFLVDIGADVNKPCDHLYSHGTPLHHAVCSGSLDAVKLLLQAGAKLDTKDTVYGGTPLGWAEYGGHAHIAAFLMEAEE